VKTNLRLSSPKTYLELSDEEFEAVPAQLCAEDGYHSGKRGCSLLEALKAVRKHVFVNEKFLALDWF